MCDPLTLTIASTAVAAGGQLFNGMQQQQAYQQQAAFSERQATMEGQRGAYESARTREQNDRKLAAMRGSYLSSGIALEGSPSEVIADSADQASLDEQAIRYGARVRAGNLQFEARQARSNAGTAMMGAVLGAVGTTLGGVSDYRDFQSRRTFITNPYAR
jgi:hypothetical protein